MRIPALLMAAATVIAVAGAACSAPPPPPPSPLCSRQSAPVSDGAYIVQNNEYGSRARQCISLTGGTAFTVTESAISVRTDGSPGGFPSIYQGCHWGQCSQGDLARTQFQASALRPGTVTTSWQTSQPGSGIYNVVYDIWFASKPRMTGRPDCAELMVWLNRNGPVQPYGHRVAAGVSVGGQRYDLWRGGYTVTYLISTGTDAVSGLDVGVLADDAMRRGYLPAACYLQDVEAGFEIWQGGTGLSTVAFSVTVTR